MPVPPSQFSLTNLTTAIAAIGALGTASAGLVDASKLAFGVRDSGFVFIKLLVEHLSPPSGQSIPRDSALSLDAITDTVHSNWINGMSLADQKSAAKTLLKLRINTETAPRLAHLMGVDGPTLTSVAAKLANGEAMTQPEMDTYARFDVLLAASIDRAYQRADLRYKSTAKTMAGGIAILLAVLAAWVDGLLHWRHLDPHNLFGAIIVGLLATPLAPIAKDLTSALTTAFTAVQSVKR